MRNAIIVLAVTAVTTTGIMAQQRSTPPAPPQKTATTAGANALTSSQKFTYDIYKDDLIKSAEQMKEADYSFKPAGVAPDVRTFGQIIGHVADASAGFCAGASGQAPPATVKDVEHAKTKAEIQKGLADAFAFCDKVWAATTDANAAHATKLPFVNTDSTRLGVLAFSTAHMSEHYGNIVTYMRAKGLVPPSSQPKK